MSAFQRKVASVVSRFQTASTEVADEACLCTRVQHPEEEIQSLRERTRWTADTIGVHVTLRQKNAHGATFIFPYIIRHLPLRPIKIPIPSGPSPKEHVTILIEARRNSDGSGATTRFYRAWFLAMGRDKKSREYFTIPFLAWRTSQIRDVGAGVDVNLVPVQIKWINSTFLSRVSRVDFHGTCR